MTGYGKGVVEYDNKRISVEIRSLNSKQLDNSLKMPSTYREQEFLLRQKISKALVRGKVDTFVNVELLDQKRSLPVNKELFEDYYNQLSSINNDINKGADFMQAILQLPGVLQAEKKEIEQGEWDALHEAVGIAIEEITKFRVQEGNVMITDLLKRIETIRDLKIKIEPFEKERIETIKNRIHENMEKIVVDYDNNRLEQEMIFYIEKLDVTEEKVRLENHLNYFCEICEKEDNVGRKLGFVTQEIGREINTLGSKSNNSEMQKIVVNMKDELEKIKEQVLNIL
ncbi:MAG: YicC family protein [Bacteroidetes bacterium]|nr:YicC family protein [Bacteroidota bacterium]